ncbi:ParH-like protein [Streptomyces beihaiensis]|uniref:ParH-like protein n=1 Tax=Streptomyces beihaiensis TaxID=2984495 RepID=A0ABT3TQ76_9ACTN|nr:ParH-like protein [Streptomyces beihaiensis]MCX3058213.1 ParH-like protein [Streptomyces beihaiensis]
MADDGPRRMWERCRGIVDGLELPDPFDAVTFIGMLGRARERTIEVVPIAHAPHIPCGLLVTTDHTDRILYATDTTPLHQQHILLHEAAHLICGHDKAAPTDSEAASPLLPHLSGALVKRVLGRTVYTEPLEREAELLASLILCRAEAGPHAPPRGTPQTRLESVFGTRRSRNTRRG